MPKSLEYLRDIRDLINEIYEDETDENRLASRDCFRKYCTYIEEELKERDELSQRLWIVSCEKSELLKYKQTLEIIKNKGVFVHLLQQSKNVEEYNSLMLIAFKKMAERDYVKAVKKFCLIQEEYNLLKEILL